jgi:hypothetical protein
VAGSNWAGAVNFTNSCTTTAAVGWATGNITAVPLFIANGSGYGINFVAGDYRLRMGSPCVNAGTNQDWMTNSVDLDGNARILNNFVDIGAYERLLWQGTIYSIP